MRIRVAAVASAVLACFAVALSSVATAAPKHNHGLTINVTPKRILAGEGVLIYGQLNGSDNANQTIALYHHLNGSHRPGYSLVGTTTTNSVGFYSFNRAEGVVMTNREWFVRERGAHGVHSRTVGVLVAPLVGLSASTPQADTRQWIDFTGQVTPNHAGDVVYLQEQVNGGDTWHTLKRGHVGVGSFFHIPYRWQVPGIYNVRVLIRRDARNIAGESDPVTVTIQQAERAGFSITTDDPIITYGQSATISGVLDMAGKKTPDANVTVSLWGRVAGHAHFSLIADSTTGTNGSYSFTVTPQQNTNYQVRMTFAPHRSTAVLFEGVKDVVTLTPSSTTSSVNGTVTFTGTVTPDKDGDVVYLQRLGKDSHWHTVGVALVHGSSAFTFAWTFGNPGPHTFRARVPGDGVNVGGASAPVTIAVATTPTT
jgi:hypothetical protein